MKQTEKLNNGKYLMTLSFGEVLTREEAAMKLEAFIRDLWYMDVALEDEYYHLTKRGSTANLILDIESPTLRRFSNHWRMNAPNGTCEVVSFSEALVA